MKRIISLILTLAAALSLLVLPAGAASTPEEALGEVNIYNGGYRMAYDLISAPQRGVCLFKCGTDRNLLDVHAPPHKHALITGGGG